MVLLQVELVWHLAQAHKMLLIVMHSQLLRNKLPCVSASTALCASCIKAVDQHVNVCTAYWMQVIIGLAQSGKQHCLWAFLQHIIFVYVPWFTCFDCFGDATQRSLCASQHWLWWITCKGLHILIYIAAHFTVTGCA